MKDQNKKKLANALLKNIERRKEAKKEKDSQENDEEIFKENSNDRVL